MKGFAARWLVVFLVVGLVFVGAGCATRQQPSAQAAPEQETLLTEPEESYSDVDLPPEVSAVDEAETKEPETKEADLTPYTVKAGDNLWKIARRHAVSVGEIKECNSLANPDKLRVGQVIMLPPNAHEVPVSETPRRKTESVAKAPVSVEPYSGPTVDYVIKKGDTLGGIAKAHGTTSALIRGANGLTSDKIIAGRKLKIPAPKQETLTPVEPTAPLAPVSTLEPAPSMMPPAETPPAVNVPATPPPVESIPPAEGATPAAPAIPEVPSEPIIQ